MCHLSLCLFFASFVSFFLFCVSLFLGVRLPVKEAAPPGEREQRERPSASSSLVFAPPPPAVKEKVITEKHDDYERSVDIYTNTHTHV
jgi:hypothetical protein